MTCGITIVGHVGKWQTLPQSRTSLWHLSHSPNRRHGVSCVTYVPRGTMGVTRDTDVPRGTMGWAWGCATLVSCLKHGAHGQAERQEASNGH
jgi:hypothetical protein